MFDGLLKPKFYAKCKTALKLTKTRLDVIMRKRNAVHKYLKNDIVDLLRSNLGYNAYGRAEGFLIERDRTACYELIGQFCQCASKNLSLMQKQNECPEECREAIASLVHAAARFADLPELRDFRAQINEKYGCLLDLYLSKEFVQKLRGEPPTKEMKLHLMHEIAQEFAIKWDAKDLEQKLFKPPSLEKDKATQGYPDNTDNGGKKRDKNVNESLQKPENPNAQKKLSDDKGHTVPKRSETNLSSVGRKDLSNDKPKLPISSEDEGTDFSRRESTDRDSLQTSSSSVGSASEDDVTDKKPFYYRFIPPPYTRPKIIKEESLTTNEPPKPSSKIEEEKDVSRNDSVNETKHENNSQNGSVNDPKPKPRSVRRRFARPLPSDNNVGSDSGARPSSSSTDQEETRRAPPDLRWEDNNQRDEEEKIMDGLLMHYSKKKTPNESKIPWRGNLKLPPGRQPVGNSSVASRRSNSILESSSPPARVASLPPEPTPPWRPRGHARASSLQSDLMAGRVHPKMPDYEDLTSRLAGLRG